MPGTAPRGDAKPPCGAVGVTPRGAEGCAAAGGGSALPAAPLRGGAGRRLRGAANNNREVVKRTKSKSPALLGGLSAFDASMSGACN